MLPVDVHDLPIHGRGLNAIQGNCDPEIQHRRIAKDFARRFLDARHCFFERVFRPLLGNRPMVNTRPLAIATLE